MASIKFTNVKFSVGGGKKYKRMRRQQNYTIGIYLEAHKPLLEKPEEWLIANLPLLTRGKVWPSVETRAIKKK